MAGTIAHRTGGDPARSRRARTAIWVAVVALAAAAAALLSFRSTQSGSELESWEAAPQPVLSEEAVETAAGCRASTAAQEATPQSIPIAESRGDVVFLVVEYPDTIKLCLGPEENAVDAGGFSHDTPPTSLGPREVATLVMHGAGQGADARTTIVGRVGEKVTGIEIHPHGPGLDAGALDAPPETITATVEHGWYAAWWPGDASETATIDLTVHLADGAASKITAFEP